MRFLLKTAAVAALLLTTSLAAAATELPTERLDAPNSPTQLYRGCLLGNGNPANAWVVGLDPTNSISLLVDPNVGCACDLGVDLNKVRVYISSAGVDCDVTLRAHLRSADTTDPACPVPGTLECSGEAVVIPVSDGIKQYELPIKCPCADVNFLYFIEIEVVDGGTCAGTPDVGFAFEQIGDECQSYVNGAADAVIAAGGPLSWTISATAACCNKPVGVDGTSWGTMKSLFGLDQ